MFFLLNNLQFLRFFVRSIECSPFYLSLEFGCIATCWTLSAGAVELIRESFSKSSSAQVSCLLNYVRKYHTIQVIQYSDTNTGVQTSVQIILELHVFCPRQEKPGAVYPSDLKNDSYSCSLFYQCKHSRTTF